MTQHAKQGMKPKNKTRKTTITETRNALYRVTVHIKEPRKWLRIHTLLPPGGWIVWAPRLRRMQNEKESKIYQRRKTKIKIRAKWSKQTEHGSRDIQVLIDPNPWLPKKERGNVSWALKSLCDEKKIHRKENFDNANCTTIKQNCDWWPCA